MENVNLKNLSPMGLRALAIYFETWNFIASKANQSMRELREEHERLGKEDHVRRLNNRQVEVALSNQASAVAQSYLNPSF